jgi:hypothetical protein
MQRTFLTRYNAIITHAISMIFKDFSQSKNIIGLSSNVEFFE